MNKLFKLILLLIVSFFILLNSQLHARENLSPSQVASLIDLTSVPKTYSIHAASVDDNMYQVTFINNTTKQRRSFTFAQDMIAKKDPELKSFVETSIKFGASAKSGPMENRIISYKKFFAHNQPIYYYVADEFENNKLFARGIFSLLGNYRGKCIVLQSYGPPQTFSEKEALEFFSKIKFFTQNF